MLILHLSDLHFGVYSRFEGDDPREIAASLAHAVEEAGRQLGIAGAVDLVVVTGDLAEAARPREFDIAESFLGALAGELGLDRRRFVFVPGNHDVSWTACKKVEADQQDDGFDDAELRKRFDAVKLQRYDELLCRFYQVDRVDDVAKPLDRGARLYVYEDLRLCIAALNSCEVESSRPQDHRGHFSVEQAKAAMAALRSASAAAWLKIVAIHHNPLATVPANIADWREGLKKASRVGDELMARYESDVLGLEGREHLQAISQDAQVQLVLHGHHHAKDEHVWRWRKGQGHAHVLSAGSLSLRSDRLPRDEPASFRLIAFGLGQPGRSLLHTRSLIHEPRARLEGEIRRGAFVLDPAEMDDPQRLDLPAGFAAEPGSEPGPDGRGAPDAAPGAPSRKPLTPPGELLCTYRLRLSAKYARWDLASAGVAQAGGAGRPVQATLDGMYLPLRLAAGIGPPDAAHGNVLSPERLLDRERPLVVRGPAGAGKTTWMRWNFRRLLEDEAAFPIMLVLRDLARAWSAPGCAGPARSLDAFLKGWLAEGLGAGMESAADLWSGLDIPAGPRPVLLVDGWDETGRLGEELREKLAGLMAGRPRLLVLVTSRPYGEGQPSHTEGFEVLDIQPLANPEIASLANRFFSHCYGDDPDARAAAAAFIAALERAPEPLALARNPLLLTMMLLLGRSRPLPDKRHLLYEACIDNLLNALPRRREELGALAQPDQWRPEDSEERKRVVAALAHGLQSKVYGEGHRVAIAGTWDDLAGRLPSGWKPDQRHGFLAWLAGAAGLLTDYADGTLSFTHLSFQEYLTAWHLDATVEGAAERIELVHRHFSQRNWFETLRLWGALVDRQSPERLEPVLEHLSTAFTAGSPEYFDGFELCGMMFADGLGTPASFHRWLEALPAALLESLRDFGALVQAWSASRQKDRRNELGRSLAARVSRETWFEWAFYDGFASGLGIEVPPPRRGLLSPAIADALLGGFYGPDLSVILAGRFLCGAVALWPEETPEVGLLQVWPSYRRLVGIRLQLALALGANRRDLRGLALRLAKFPSYRPLLVESIFHQLYSASRSYFSLHEIMAAAQDYAIDAAALWNLSDGQIVVRFGATPDDYQRFNLLKAANHYSRFDFQKHLDWIPHQLESLDLGRFAAIDCLSDLRSRARAVLARGVSEKGREASLMSTACRLSVNPTDDTTRLDSVLAAQSDFLHPLWPALARHVARRASAADRELLIDLARHPERCEPPLSLGLQAIVRGDLLLDDGSILTLDELADEVGLPHLPYLDEMPPPLDWRDFEPLEREETPGGSRMSPVP